MHFSHVYPKARRCTSSCSAGPTTTPPHGPPDRDLGDRDADLPRPRRRAVAPPRRRPCPLSLLDAARWVLRTACCAGSSTRSTPRPAQPGQARPLTGRLTDELTTDPRRRRGHHGHHGPSSSTATAPDSAPPTASSPSTIPPPTVSSTTPRRSGGSPWTEIQRALQAADSAPPIIVAVGITNQRGTTCCGTGRRARPSTRAIVWQDTRTAPIATALAPSGARRCGSAPAGRCTRLLQHLSLHWLLEDDADCAAGPRPASWRSAPSTRGSCTSSAGEPRHVSAPRTRRHRVYDLRPGEWYGDWLDALNIPRSRYCRRCRRLGGLATTSAACSAPRCRSRLRWPTSQRRCSGRAACAPARRNDPRHGHLPRPQHRLHAGDSDHGLSTISPGASTGSSHTPWRATRRPAPPCNGSATAPGSSTPRPRPRRSPAASPTHGGSTSSRRSPGSPRPTGTPRPRPDDRHLSRHDRGHLARATLEGIVYSVNDFIDTMAEVSGRITDRVGRRASPNDLCCSSRPTARRHGRPPREHRGHLRRRRPPRRTGQGNLGDPGGLLPPPRHRLRLHPAIAESDPRRPLRRLGPGRRTGEELDPHMIRSTPDDLPATPTSSSSAADHRRVGRPRRGPARAPTVCSWRTTTSPPAPRQPLLQADPWRPALPAELPVRDGRRIGPRTREGAEARAAPHPREAVPLPDLRGRPRGQSAAQPWAHLLRRFARRPGGAGPDARARGGSPPGTYLTRKASAVAACSTTPSPTTPGTSWTSWSRPPRGALVPTTPPSPGWCAKAAGSWAPRSTTISPAKQSGARAPSSTRRGRGRRRPRARARRPYPDPAPHQGGAHRAAHDDFPLNTAVFRRSPDRRPGRLAHPGGRRAPRLHRHHRHRLHRFAGRRGRRRAGHPLPARRREPHHARREGQPRHLVGLLGGPAADRRTAARHDQLRRLPRTLDHRGARRHDHRRGRQADHGPGDGPRRSSSGSSSSSGSGTASAAFPPARPRPSPSPAATRGSGSARSGSSRGSPRTSPSGGCAATAARHRGREGGRPRTDRRHRAHRRRDPPRGGRRDGTDRLRRAGAAHGIVLLVGGRRRRRGRRGVRRPGGAPRADAGAALRAARRLRGLGRPQPGPPALPPLPPS